MNICCIFPGQGSQKIGMSKEFFDKYQNVRDLLLDSSDFLKIDFYKLLFAQNELINSTEFTQPAIALSSYMAYIALKNSVSFKQKSSLGHSLGEISALSINGGIDLKKSLKLLNKRGFLMQESSKNIESAMLVVLGLDDDKIKEICKNERDLGKKIWAANFNCDGQVVVAGIKQDILSIESNFKDSGAKKTILLNMSVASHCPIQEYASKEILNYLDINETFLPVISNATAKEYHTSSKAKELLSKQLVMPVLYKDCIKNAIDIDCFVEFGASVLKGINKKITKIPTFSITNLKDLDEFIKFYEENI